ncbi:17600_t:CDS:2 [Funneliformis caledonium]|uniref:17600_t:CDS:1 n=1 Tax=Funneliformis caledonium TaxID=1117310 RepID=A0A9N9IAU3_9GLOM|nr:17600_t:CDS:2 [Funneliformis caledonium]
MHKVLVPISSVSLACKTRGDTSASGVVCEMTAQNVFALMWWPYVIRRIGEMSKREDPRRVPASFLFRNTNSFLRTRNRKTHKNSLNRSKTASASELSQQLRDALELLRLAPDQQLNFAGAFERCARWVYRRRN